MPFWWLGRPVRIDARLPDTHGGISSDTGYQKQHASRCCGRCVDGEIIVCLICEIISL